MRLLLAALAALALAVGAPSGSEADAPSSLTPAEAYEIIARYPWPVDTAMEIAWCESRLTPSVSNGHYRGLFQLGPEYDFLLEGDVFDAAENTRVAFLVWQRWGETFKAWAACL